MRIMGNTNHSTSVHKPHLIIKGKRLDCNMSNHVPFVVPGLSSPTSSSAPSPSSSQESISANRENRDIENPVSERSRGTNGELRGNPLQESTERTVEAEEVQRDVPHELPDWLQEFRENLVDESILTEPWRRHFQFVL